MELVNVDKRETD